MIRIDECFISVIKYKKILKVELNEVRLKMNHYELIVYGNELYIFSLNKDEIILKGKILKVEFNYEGI